MKTDLKRCGIFRRVFNQFK